MKYLSLIILSALLLACGSSKQVTTTRVDESQWPIEDRLHDRYYENLKSCLSSEGDGKISSIKDCFGSAGYLLNVSNKTHTRKLKIDSIIQLSYEETDDMIKTLLLLNAEDSLHLSINYDNCVPCPTKVKTFELFYRTSMFKTSVISGQGF